MDKERAKQGVFLSIASLSLIFPVRSNAVNRSFGANLCCGPPTTAKARDRARVQLAKKRKMLAEQEQAQEVGATEQHSTKKQDL